MNWLEIQALATVTLVLLAVVDSIVYYGWHAKHERENQGWEKLGNALRNARIINPYSPENIKRLQEENRGESNRERS